MKDIPVPDRPAIPLFPSGAVYFRRWYTVRWFFVLCVPIISSAAALWLRGHGATTALFFVFFGACVSAWLFVALQSGLISSTWGTHFRASEPVSYWAQIAVGAAIYLGLSIVGYLV